MVDAQKTLAPAAFKMRDVRAFLLAGLLGFWIFVFSAHLDFFAAPGFAFYFYVFSHFWVLAPRRFSKCAMCAPALSPTLLVVRVCSFKNGEYSCASMRRITRVSW